MLGHPRNKKWPHIRDSNLVKPHADSILSDQLTTLLAQAGEVMSSGGLVIVGVDNVALRV